MLSIWIPMWYGNGIILGHFLFVSVLCCVFYFFQIQIQKLMRTRIASGLIFNFDPMKWFEGNICHYIYLFVRIEWNDDRAKLKIFIKFDFKMYAVRFSQKRIYRRWTEAIKFIAKETEAWLAWIEKPFHPRSIYYLQTNFDSSLLFCELNCIQSSLKMVAFVADPVCIDSCLKIP